MKPRSAKSKPWRVEKVGNASITIYHRKKLHKRSRKRYPIYEVVDYSTGMRTLRSFSDPDEAVREAKRIAGLLSAGELTAATMRNSEAEAYGRALEHLRGTGVSVELAAACFAEAFKILRGNKVVEAAKEFIRRYPADRPVRTIGDVTAELLQLTEKRKKRKKRTSTRYIEDLRIRLKAFGTAFPNVRIDSITGPTLQAYFNNLDGASRTVKNFRDTVNVLFRYAEDNGYISRGENPVSVTRRIEVDNGAEIEIFSPEEVTRLLAAAPDRFKPVIAIQAFAGLRSAEVQRLDWHDVRIARGHIEINATNAKTASRRLVPITPNLAAWLSPFAARRGKVFPHKSRAYFHELQAEVAARTEVKSDAAKGIEARDPVKWKHNALRHSFISYRVADIQNVNQVALESGNSAAMIFSNYRELVTSEDAKLWFSVSPKQPANVVSMKGGNHATA